MSIVRCRDNIISYKNMHPKIDEKAYVNPYAMVMGDVTLHSGVSLWPGVIIRGDKAQIEINEFSGLLDNVLIESSRGYPVRIGANVLVSHNSILNGCQIGDGVLIGKGVQINEGAEVCTGAVLAARTIVPRGVNIPKRAKVRGAPAEIIGNTTDKELEIIRTKHKEIMARARDYGRWFVTRQV